MRRSTFAAAASTDTTTSRSLLALSYPVSDNDRARNCAPGLATLMRLLMIDDDTSLASMVSEYFVENGFEFEARHSVEAGLTELEVGNYDALVLDVMLPDGDGFEVCRRVRGKSEIPIVMLTARGDEMDRIIGLELGADDYLGKPFNPRELLARVRAVIRRGTRSERDEALRFGALEIDRAARTVRMDGRECELTSHQFELLRVLAENAGRVLSRDELMRALRGHEIEAFDRSIDVHISRIRAVLEENPKRPRRVLTVRGAGYVFARNPED